MRLTSFQINLLTVAGLVTAGVVAYRLYGPELPDTESIRDRGLGMVDFTPIGATVRLLTGGLFGGASDATGQASNHEFVDGRLVSPPTFLDVAAGTQ